MNGGKEKAVILAITKAKAEISETTEVLVPNKLWNTAVSRLYYACFYAVTGLLYSDSIFPKSHSGTSKLFNLHYVKNGVCTEEMAKHFAELFSMRQAADYEYETEYEESDVTPKDFIGYLYLVMLILYRSYAKGNRDRLSPGYVGAY